MKWKIVESDKVRIDIVNKMEYKISMIEKKYMKKEKIRWGV